MNVQTSPDKGNVDALRREVRPLFQQTTERLLEVWSAVIELRGELKRTHDLVSEVHDDTSAVREQVRALRRQNDPDSCLDLDEVADILGVSRRTVDTLIADGELPSLKIRRCRRVPRRALEAFISARAEEVRR